MSEHTKEPWISKPTAGSDGKYCTIVSESEGRAIARHVKPADAEYIITLKAQRDELLAALKRLGTSEAFTAYALGRKFDEEAVARMEYACAAIANAEKDKSGC